MGLKIGIIGGSGLYEMDGLTDVREAVVATPFGPPSDAIVHGRLGATELFFLPRHGRGHRLLPSELPFRANLWALKHLGVERVIAVGAVGSLREEIAPGHLVIPDQFIDRTFGRAGTFFGNGIVAHVGFGDPVCPLLSQSLVESARRLGATVHAGGTYVCMEGPQFSTRAESELYRSWGAAVIGMTNLQEAKLAREAELCFATLALATDYDCWRQGHDEVRIEDVLAVIHANVAMAKQVVHDVVPTLPASPECACGRALAHAIITDRTRIPARVKRDLAPIIGRYVPEEGEA
ncbi:MAG: S-methyl-5'-thioadenosine phosphorylase [Deltaproteobacteria bacterium]|nr:S-methyl-5'-thioadenosine phosphorylase [Deltaproteobacteria bacterium]